MKVALVYPPLADATQPHASLPALAAALRQRGEDPLLVDANLELMCDLLSRPRLEEALHEAEDRANRGEGSPEAALDVILRGPHVVESIEGAVADLRDCATYRDLSRLDRARRAVREAMRIHSGAWYPYQLRLSRASPALDSIDEIESWALDEDRNPYIRFLEEQVIPKIREHDCGLVGVSVSYRSQVLGAFTVAALARKMLPGASIVMGGNLVNIWGRRDTFDERLFDWADFFVPHEGESALCELLEALKGQGSFGDVPNLLSRRRNGVERGPVRSEDIERLPSLSFDGLPLGRYLAPETVFPSYTTRGCYWSRCSFCSVSPSFRRDFRARPVGVVQNELQELRRKHDARLVFFVDDCVPPGTLGGLSQALLAHGPEDMLWQCEVRFERSLSNDLLSQMYQSGCRNLAFGLESCSQDVLRKMHKGTRLDEAWRILSDCRANGLAFNLQFFFGFPGETPEEAEMTADRVLAEAYGAATLSFGTFELQVGSEVADKQAAYGLTAPTPGGELAVRLDYEPVPEHAEQVCRDLRRSLAQKSSYSNLGLGLGTHTLIVLSELGADGIAAAQKVSPEDDPMLTSREKLGACWRRGGRQTMVPASHVASLDDETESENGGEGISDIRGDQEDRESHAFNNRDLNSTNLVLYDYDLESAVEVSPVVAWILARLGDTAPVGEQLRTVVAELCDGEVSPDPAVLQLELDNAMLQLMDRGFLRLV